MKQKWSFIVVFFSVLFFLGCLESRAEQAPNNKKTEGAGADLKKTFGAEKAPLQVAKNHDDSFRYAIADVAETVIPVVVSIYTEKEMPQRSFSHPLEEFFFGPGFRKHGRSTPAPRQQGLGSGVIVSAEGYILTNNHVVEGADEITVQLADERKSKAEIVGVDPQSDLAVIRLLEPMKNLPVAFLGESEPLRVGEWVVAVGSPFGLRQTVTAGVISAKGVHDRGINSYENFLQTDAAINPGNSGGGLFAMDGSLIGINTAILSKSGGFQGIGFAIPVDMAKNIMRNLIDFGEVRRGWLGVGIQEVSEEIIEAMDLSVDYGVMLTEVYPETPAEKAGLLAGDLIIALDGEKVADMNDLRNRIALINPGTEVEVTFIRDKKQKVIKVEIGSREGDKLAGITEGGREGGAGMKVRPLANEELKKWRLPYGLIIESVTANSPAAKVGLAKGMVLIKANARELHKAEDLYKEVKMAQKRDKAVLLYVQYENHRRFLPLPLESGNK
jgi:serine protease Do